MYRFLFTILTVFSLLFITFIVGNVSAQTCPADVESAKTYQSSDFPISKDDLDTLLFQPKITVNGPHQYCKDTGQITPKGTTSLTLSIEPKKFLDVALPLPKTITTGVNFLNVYDDHFKSSLDSDGDFILNEAEDISNKPFSFIVGGSNLPEGKTAKIIENDGTDLLIGKLVTNGVLVIKYPTSGQVDEKTPAKIQACDRDSPILTVNPGDYLILECGSLIIKSASSNVRDTLTTPDGFIFSYRIPNANSGFEYDQGRITPINGPIFLEHEGKVVEITQKTPPINKQFFESPQPPAGQPPAGQPPAGQPPAGQPPAGQPPAGQPPEQNRPPTVKIVTKSTLVKENSTVVLDGSKTVDPDKDEIKSWEWAQVGGNTIIKKLQGSDSPRLQFTVPEVGRSGGTVSFKLTATDAKDSKDDSTILLEIQNVNKNPIAKISKVTPKQENSTILLDGSASVDPDGDPLMFIWKQLDNKSKVQIDNPSSAVASFIAPSVDVDTTLAFMLYMKDDKGGKANQKVDVLVKNVNKPPKANAGEDLVANETDIIILNGNKSKDQDKFDKLKYSWIQTKGDLLIDLKNSNTVETSFKAPYVKQNNSLFSFKLTVTDPKGANSSDSVDVRLLKISDIIKNPPIAKTKTKVLVKEGDNVELTAAKSIDPDPKEVLSYKWKQIAGIPVNITQIGSEAKFKAPQVEQNSTLSFNLTVTNKKNLSDTETIHVNIANIKEGFPLMFIILIGIIASAAAAGGILVYLKFFRRDEGPERVP